MKAQSMDHTCVYVEGSYLTSIAHTFDTLHANSIETRVRTLCDIEVTYQWNVGPGKPEHMQSGQAQDTM